MTARLLSIGLAAPDSRLDLERYLALAKSLAGDEVRVAALEGLTRRTGIAERGCCIVDGAGGQSLYRPDVSGFGPGTRERMALYTQFATRLGFMASTEAITCAAINPTSITHIVTASCTGFEAPGFDQGLIEGLGLRQTVRRTHVGFMGCHAAINALAVATAFAESDASATVLVCCAELCSLHYHFSDRADQMISNALFADGGAAAIVRSHGPTEAPAIAGFASALFPRTEGLMGWRIGDHGFEMTLDASVPEALGKCVPEWIASSLDRSALSMHDVGGWAIHPGGPRILRVVADSLGLDDAQVAPSLHVLRAHGNMSSPTVLFILRALWDRGVARPWMGMAFGPGLAGEAVLIR